MSVPYATLPGRDMALLSILPCREKDERRPPASKLPRLECPGRGMLRLSCGVRPLISENWRLIWRECRLEPLKHQHK